MQSFHVNEKTDLETFRLCLNYLVWSHYFLGKIQMLFQVRLSAGERRGRKESSSCSPVYSFTTSPMAQTAADKPSPAASWQMNPESWTATAAAQQNSWAREQRLLPPAGPTPGTGQGDPRCQMPGCALSSTENTWASCTGITSPRDDNTSSVGWHMAQPNKGATGARQLVVLPWGAVAATQLAALTASARVLSAPFSYTAHKQYAQLALLSFCWNPLSPFSHSGGNKQPLGISVQFCVMYKHLATISYKSTGHILPAFLSSQCCVCLQFFCKVICLKKCGAQT